MNTTTVERRLRTFLFVIAACLCVGTIVELFLLGHTKTLVQLTPFVLCGAGALAVAAALARPKRGTLMALRVVMGLLLLGSLFGMYEHIENNLAFELEIRPNATASDVWLEALKGDSPLLAPGALALAACLAVAATYEHPALARRQANITPARTAIGDSSASQRGRS
jgi:hypothetical protein